MQGVVWKGKGSVRCCGKGKKERGERRAPGGRGGGGGDVGRGRGFDCCCRGIVDCNWEKKYKRINNQSINPSNERTKLLCEKEEVLRFEAVVCSVGGISAKASTLDLDKNARK